jgi:hypothetical protein
MSLHARQIPSTMTSTASLQAVAPVKSVAGSINPLLEARRIRAGSMGRALNAAKVNSPLDDIDVAAWERTFDRTVPLGKLKVERESGNPALVGAGEDGGDVVD